MVSSQPNYWAVADGIVNDYQGRQKSTSDRANSMLDLVHRSELSDDIKAVLAVLIRHYEEAESA